MKKITKLTAAQWAQIDELKKEWIENASKPVDRVEVTEAVKILYELQGLDLPKIIFTDSPLTAILAKSIINTIHRPLRDSLGDSLGDSLDASLEVSLWDSLGDSLRGSLEDSLGDSLRVSLWDSLGDSLRGSLGDSIWDSLEGSLRDSLRDSLEGSLRDSLRDSLGGSIWDSLWDSLEGSLGDSLGGSLEGSIWVSLRDSLWDSIWDSIEGSLRDSLRDSLEGSLGDSLRGSLGDSIWDSLGDSLGDSLDASLEVSLWDSLGDSLRGSLEDSLGDSLRDSLWDSLWGSLEGSLGDSLRDSLGDSLRGSLFFYWQKSYCAFVSGGSIAGVNYCRDKYNKYLSICKNLSFILPHKDLCIVALPPVFCGWSDNGAIHAEDRAAVEYADGFKIWAIEGYRVPESLVMQPELQTINEINNEQNEEIKRIRINRYGWDRYLTESDASVLDFWTSPNGYLESLMRCGDYTILCTYDPSTGRPYSLEVDPSIETCERAQNYLLAPELALAGLGIECASTYPTTRT